MELYEPTNPFVYMNQTQYQKALQGDILHDLDRVVRDPRIIDMKFAIQLTDPTGYLNTTFIPNSYDSVVELDCLYPDVSIDILDGAQNPSEMRFYMGCSDGYWRTGFAGTYLQHDVADTARHLHKLTGGGERYLDNTLLETFGGSIITQLDPFYLWGKGTYRYPNTWYYGFRAWRGTTLVHDFRPIIVGSNMYSETPAPSNCFWDMVNKCYVEPDVGECSIAILQSDLTENAIEKMNQRGPIHQQGVSFDCQISSEYKDLVLTHKDYTPSMARVNVGLGAEYRDFYETHVTINGPEPVDCKFNVELSPEYIILTQVTETFTHDSCKLMCELKPELLDV